MPKKYLGCLDFMFFFVVVVLVFEKASVLLLHTESDKAFVEKISLS